MFLLLVLGALPPLLAPRWAPASRWAPYFAVNSRAFLLYTGILNRKKGISQKEQVLILFSLGFEGFKQ